ncbi:uncharacterized protein [Drosophila takahashii]|uniref:uncharacterized protein n=1 Tax=Drosophila takahashii TaxID=29030 RepID=UPI003899326C
MDPESIVLDLDKLVNLQTDRHQALRSVLQNFRKDSQTRKTRIYLKKRLDQVEELRNAFRETHSVIVNLDGFEDSSYAAKNFQSEFEERYMDAYCALAEDFDKLGPETTAPPAAAGNADPELRVNMPQMTVPKFSGACVDWPGYYDAFTSLIHNNHNLSNVQRLHFLKDSLPIGRDNDIRQMQLTDVNYAVAWGMMIKRYNNPRLVFSHHMNAIYALPRLQKDTTDSIRLMLSTVNVCLAAFRRVQALDGESQHWLAHYVASKLPKETHNAWEHHQGSSSTVPSYKDLESFLNDRLVIMDAIENRSSSYDSNAGLGSTDPVKRVRVHNAQEHVKRSNSACYHCGGDHILRRCPLFLELDCYRRKDIVSRAKLCVNCLSKSHALSRCTSSQSCQVCGQRHHTLLHFPVQAQNQPSNHAQSHSARPPTPQFVTPASMETVSEQNPHASYRCHSATSSEFSSKNVLLATARIMVQNPTNGLQAVINALIDQGSEATIVSEHVVQSLHLKRSAARASIFGVGQGSGVRCKYTANFKITSIINPHFSLDVNSAYVLNSVTSCLPRLSFSPRRWSHIQGLPLADPNYYRSKRVDLIVGVDLLAQIMLPDTRIGLPDEPIAQNTRFGWLLSGRAEGVRKSTQLRCHLATLDTESLLKRFCEVESVPDRSTETEEDLWCETFFQKTHVRRSDGRYVVRLPFKTYLDPAMVLGRSHQMALNRFMQLERRLSNNPERWNKYVEEIEEYFSLEQIAPAVGSESSLVKRTSANRHVASCVLPHHAVFKEELYSTKQRIVFDASSRTSNGRSLNDILCTGPTLQNDMSSVMLNWRKYRFVFTADIQKMYRCIDVHPEDAQYQRILWRAADGAINVYALSTLTFGTASAPFTAIRVIQQLAKDEQLSFPKAEEVLMNEIYVDDILSGGHTIEEAEEKATSVSSTKRIILSSIARLFDPLGLIAPVIISGKLILKEVTMAKKMHADGSQTVLDWDDAVPDNIAERWRGFRDDLLRIGEMHAFCDGSSTSYAAAVYLRVEHQDGRCYSSLMAAKSKVTPAKPLTIPRTELSGAVLAIKLVRWLTLAKCLSSFPVQTFYWTDATIVLHWLHGDVNRWKTFVANRVAFVLDHSSPVQWRHVGTSENPADCATRGLSPIELKNFELWWRGPEWLVRDQGFWPSTDFGQVGVDDAALEAKVPKVRVHHAVAQPSFLEKFSTLSQALRVTGYIMRFKNNAVGKEEKRIGPLSIEELDYALLAVVRIVQRESFATDLSAVRDSKRLPSRSKLLNLSPVLVEGILRVRGRLRHSKLSHERRHPIILPSSHHFTELVIRHSHYLTLHGGAQMTLAHTRQRFWILTGKQAVRRIIRKCVRCFRTRPTTTTQLMGDLPVHRVNPPSRPFIATGVDYTGAIEIKAARLRGTSFYKGYIAVFICLATKAVHLEAVTGLTTEHFLLALDSDNGTNFVGADNVMKAVYRQMRADYEQVIAPKLATQRTQWHFNPPLSPNFGGLWEANVKSVKYHLKRVIGDRRLTYEELSTVLVTIEACLNSRPLCPLTADADDLEVLTPAHFLIGDSMLAPPEYQPQSRSFAEQFLIQQAMIRHFWKAWSRDWLAHLQQRPKWCQEAENFRLDDLVIIKDDRYQERTAELAYHHHIPEDQDKRRMSHARSSIGGRHVQFTACPDSWRATRSADRSRIWTKVYSESMRRNEKKKEQSVRSNHAERTPPV